MLKTVSSRLMGLVRPSDTVARIGGDEFVVLLRNPESRDNVAKIATRVIDELNAPMLFDDIFTYVGTSIGIAYVTTELASPNDILRHADAAMYEAKAAGKNTFRFADYPRTQCSSTENS